ncbi:Myomegalin [Dirofilaria immitis]
MDPTSFGFVAIIAVLIIIISIIVFKMYPKETDFEKAYGENALRLFTEDRATKAKSTKSKNKGKNGEKKKDFGTEEKQNRVEKSANGSLLGVLLSTNGHSGIEELNNMNDGENDAKMNRKKLKGRQMVAENKQYTELAKDEKIARSMEELSGHRDISQKIDAEPEEIAVTKIFDDDNKNIGGGERKAKKKNRVRRNEEHFHEMPKEEIKMTKETIPAMEVTVLFENEEKKAKPKKANPLNDINANKFQTRLNAIAELEPEYITFLTNYINNVNTQKVKLDDEIALMRKQIADKDRLVLQCTDKLTAAEQKDSEIAVLKKTLTEEKRKRKLFEQTVCSQLSSNAQEKSYLQRKYDQLQGEFGAMKEELKKAQSVIHSTPPPIDIKSYQQQIDRLKAELTSSKNRCSQQEMELNQRIQTIQQIRNELQNQDCQIKHLNKTNTLLEKRLQNVEDNAKAERDTLEMKLKDTMKVAEELSVMTSEIRDEMLQHRGNAETVVYEREKHCEQIHTLNAQLMDANRECVRYLNDCATYSKKLAEMETANAELSNQLEALQNARTTNVKNCDELTQEVEKYRKQLVNIVEAHDKDIAKLKNELEYIQTEKENYVKQLSVNISREAAAIAQCRKELNEFKNEYNKKLNRIVSLEKEIANYKKIEMKSETMVSSCDDMVMHEKMMEYKVQSASKDDVVICNDNVKLKIKELKNQNQQLREANYKVVEISQQQETIFKKHLEEVKKNHEKAVQQYYCDVFKTLCKIVPSNITLPHLPSVHDINQFHKWLKDVENMLQERENIKQVNKNEKNDDKDKMNLAKVAELKASNRRYRAALANLASHIDAIEHETISKEKEYFGEISRLRQEINEQLKKQLENECKRKLELISQASKLCEIINRPQNRGSGEMDVYMDDA